MIGSLTIGKGGGGIARHPLEQEYVPTADSTAIVTKSTDKNYRINYSKQWRFPSTRPLPQILAALSVLYLATVGSVDCFLNIASAHGSRKRSATTTSLWSQSSSLNQQQQEDISRLQEKARALLAKSKAKLEAQDKVKEQDAPVGAAMDAGSNLPFFASPQQEQLSSSTNRDSVIKSRDEKTGLITTDGEKLAALSDQEQWERRSLLDVFQSEIDEDKDIYSVANRQLLTRDVAASIAGLRKSLQNEDYQKIFDKRNYFIGEP